MYILHSYDIVREELFHVNVDRRLYFLNKFRRDGGEGGCQREGLRELG